MDARKTMYARIHGSGRHERGRARARSPPETTGRRHAARAHGGRLSDAAQLHAQPDPPHAPGALADRGDAARSRRRRVRHRRLHGDDAAPAIQPDRLFPPPGAGAAHRPGDRRSMGRDVLPVRRRAGRDRRPAPGGGDAATGGGPIPGLGARAEPREQERAALHPRGRPAWRKAASRIRRSCARSDTSCAPPRSTATASSG